jgi:multimeric flavodoxin WrbA/protein-tyrosine-phosphatase
MFVLGLQGSPRIKGNTSILLSSFLAEAKKLGARVENVHVARKDITPCQECNNCEKKGFCPLEDEMQDMFHLLRQADIVVMGTPVFFYGPTAQMKALIDRTQTLWARKYVHKIVDPGRKWRIGVLLSVGATKGKNLFVAIDLITKYFFDAVGASFDDRLTYREIEEAGEIKKHPTALKDAQKKARALVKPLLRRKKVLFFGSGDACRSQMASAFAQYRAGDKIEVESAGSAPAQETDALMAEVMAERGIDMAFRKPKSIESAVEIAKPDLIVSMGHEETELGLADVQRRAWGLADPSGESIGFMRKLRDSIEQRVDELLAAELAGEQTG